MNHLLSRHKTLELRKAPQNDTKGIYTARPFNKGL